MPLLLLMMLLLLLLLRTLSSPSLFCFALLVCWC
jgi:hypothetical protein